GFFTILASSRNLDAARNFKPAKDAPGLLGAYLDDFGYTQKQAKDKEQDARKDADHFCQRLRRLRELDHMSDGPSAVKVGDTERVLAHLEAITSPELIWAVAQGYMAMQEPNSFLRETAVTVLNVARKRLADVPMLGIAAHHEWTLALAATDAEEGA